MRTLLTSLFFVLLACSVSANPVKTENAKATLIASSQNITSGDTFYLALELDLREHWHTYWINPGAAGLPTQIRWDLPTGLVAGEIIWPTPKAIYLGELVNYGYEGKTLYPIPFTATDQFDGTLPATIIAHASWLVCEEICVPEQADLYLSIGPGSADVSDNQQRIQGALAAMPKTASPDQLQGGFSLIGDQIRFSFIGPLVSGFKASTSDLRFFPVDSGMVKHSVPQRVQIGKEGLVLSSAAGFRASAGTLKTLDGVLIKGTGKSAKAWQISLQEDFSPVMEILAPAPKGGLILALVFAFIGGVLLNLMPCVFPVLSMKVIGFVSAAHEQAPKIRRHGVLFLAGVLVSFLLLGGLLLVLKAAGAQIGWGFQLQYPPFVAGIALLFFVLGLNLLGVFQIGGQLMGVGGTLTKGNGNIGAFFTGVLAVVVASPCTAPAMGWALGYTLTQNAAVSMLIFLSLGLGFAAPFTLLSFRPGLLRLLPKPGPWMQRFHQLMAFPMFGAAIWLVWVLGSLSGSIAIIAMLIAFLLTGFGFWAWKGKTISKSAAIIAGILAILMIANSVADQDVSQLPLQAWSPELVQKLQGEGKTVFVDFTADWCVTCQFNKRASLSGKKMAAVFARENAVFLVADWTSRDELIAQELAKFGRVGVPLYLVYHPGNPQPIILPQLLTPAIVETALGSRR